MSNIELLRVENVMYTDFDLEDIIKYFREAGKNLLMKGYHENYLNRISMSIDTRDEPEACGCCRQEITDLVFEVYISEEPTNPIPEHIQDAVNKVFEKRGL